MNWGGEITIAQRRTYAGGGLAHLYGFKTVVEAMNDPFLSAFMVCLMENGDCPGHPYSMRPDVAPAFSRQVVERFKNPRIFCTDG